MTGDDAVFPHQPHLDGIADMDTGQLRFLEIADDVQRSPVDDRELRMACGGIVAGAQLEVADRTRHARPHLGPREIEPGRGERDARLIQQGDELRDLGIPLFAHLPRDEVAQGAVALRLAPRLRQLGICDATVAAACDTASR